MSTKITRLVQYVFGSQATSVQLGEIGSLAAGTATTTTVPANMQSAYLSNFLGGWFSCVLGGLAVNGPAIEDMNALDFLITRQLAYLCQTGVAEYDASTIYFAGSLVNNGSGFLYVCFNDNAGAGISGFVLTNTTYWRPIISGKTVRTVTTSTAILVSDNVIRSNSTSGALIHTLPTIASSINQTFIVKDVGTGGYTTQLQGNGSDTIDGNVIYSTALAQYDTLTVFNNGTTWDQI